MVLRTAAVRRAVISGSAAPSASPGSAMSYCSQTSGMKSRSSAVGGGAQADAGVGDAGGDGERDFEVRLGLGAGHGVGWYAGVLE